MPYFTLPDGEKRYMPTRAEVWRQLAAPIYPDNKPTPSVQELPGATIGTRKLLMTRRRLLQTVPLGVLAWLADMGIFPTRANAAVNQIAAGTAFSSIRTTLTGMASGDVAVFNSGNFTSDGTPLRPVNGTYMLGEQGANINIGANGSIFAIDGNNSGTINAANTTNIVISGITMTGSASFNAGNAVLYMVYANNCSIDHNVFQNWKNSSDCVVSYHTQPNTRIEYNTFNNITEGISSNNTSDTTMYKGASYSYNFFYLVTRNAIELHSDNTGAGYDGVHVNGNTVICDTNTVSGGGIPLGIVNDQASHLMPSTDMTFIGNDLWYSPGLGFECVAQNLTVAFNRLTNIRPNTSGMVIGGCQPGGAFFYGNQFRSLASGASAFGKDGGWVDSQWIGTNMVNGVETAGWSFGNTAGLAPPTYSMRTFAEVMSDLRDGQAAGSITPQIVRNALSSAPNGLVSTYGRYP